MGRCGWWWYSLCPTRVSRRRNVQQLHRQHRHHFSPLLLRYMTTMSCTTTIAWKYSNSCMRSMSTRSGMPMLLSGSTDQGGAGGDWSIGSSIANRVLLLVLGGTAMTTISTTFNESSPSSPPSSLSQESATREDHGPAKNNSTHETSTTTSAAAGSSKLLFVGTGSSTGCPRPLCALLFGDTTPSSSSSSSSTEAASIVQDWRNQYQSQCHTSALASQGNPRYNKNYRNNPSLLISVVVPDNTDSHDTTTETQEPPPPQQQQVYNVLIDAGKTFREGALRWLPHANVHSLDAIVLTHEHMDAAAGLDDVRGFQTSNRTTATKATSSFRPMPLFVSGHCLDCLQDQFPWLLPKRPNVPCSSCCSGGDSNTTTTSTVVRRHVASFDVTVFQPFQPFDALANVDDKDGISNSNSSSNPHLAITPLPVMHGEDLVSFGFAFTVGHGTTAKNVVYLSDISRMLPETLHYIQNVLPQPTHILILDALCIEQENPVHFNLPQALSLVEQLKEGPNDVNNSGMQTYLVGMNCDLFLPHDAMNERLRREWPSLNVQLAHDGLVIECGPDESVQS